MTLITSTTNPLVKRIKRLHTTKGRRAAGQSMAEGPNAFAALLQSETRPDIVVVESQDRETFERLREKDLEAIEVSETVLKALSTTVNPQSPVAVFSTPRPKPIRRHNTVVLVDVSDPGNVGTIIRSAAAFGFDVATVGQTADIWSPKVVRSSAGTVFGVYVSEPLDAVSEARATGLRVVATVAGGDRKPQSPDTEIALLIGSEAHGLPPEIQRAADETLTIPLDSAVESLNAAVAASIAMYSIAFS